VRRRKIHGVSGWDLIAPLLANAPDWMHNLSRKSESPIEQIFVYALCLVAEIIPEARRPSIDAQVQIGRFRADITVVGVFGAPRVVVECDGAEFHKNVRRDAERTTEIEKHGYRVLRVTGSEIHHNPLVRAKSLLRECGLLE
jgi:very-short-patch-repair endonuclease